MPFVFEELTDEDRRNNGFAVTMSNADIAKGMVFVRCWSVDRERNAYVIMSLKKQYYWELELHWDNKVVAIKSKFRSEARECREGETGRYKVDTFFEVIELLVSRDLESRFDEVKDMVKEGVASYGWGVPQSRGDGLVEFSPECTYRFVTNLKSYARLVDFASIN